MSDNYTYKPTTAFWKIQKLINDGLPKFKDDDQKVFVIQGGQGAGKTIAIEMLLIDYFEQTKAEITICSAELSKLKDTALNDFIKIMQDYGIYNKKYFNQTESIYRKGAGNFVEFIGLDKADVGKGRRRKIIYINEANKITLKQYSDIAARAELIIIDYNPNEKFFGTDLINDFNFINLTYLDNEYLPQNEISNILSYKKKGYKVNENGDYITDENGKPIVINQYWANMWRVYGLGEIGQVEGRIYNWSKISVQDYEAIKTQSYNYCDWGKVDPWAIGEVKYFDGCLYVHELNYESENEIERRLSPQELKAIKSGDGDDYEGLVAWKFNKCKIPQTNIVSCDSNRPNKIKSLRRSGWEYAIGVGGKLDMENRVSMLSAIPIYYTETSLNIEMEQENYCYDDKGRPIDAYNHHIDGLVYITQYLFNEGVINTL